MEDNMNDIVGVIAQQYVHAWIDVQDLRQEGYMGLMEAQKRYRENMDVTRESYYSWWIRKYIVDFLQRHGHQVRLPRRMSGKKDFHLEIDGLDDPDSVADLYMEESTERCIIQREVTEQVHIAVGRLPKRQQEVIRRLYGLCGERQQSVDRLAHEMQISPHAVAQAHYKGLQNLRVFFALTR